MEYKIAKSLAIVGIILAAVVGATETANAATAAPPPATTDWFALYLLNNPASGGGRQFEVCNEQSGANTVYVAVDDVTAGGQPLLQDVNTGWETYGANIRFNPGGCEDFNIIGGSPGDTLEGFIRTPAFYGTGDIRYN